MTRPRIPSRTAFEAAAARLWRGNNFARAIAIGHKRE